MSSTQSTTATETHTYDEQWEVGCAEDCRERSGCQRLGEIGHSQCGWCDDHDRPRHHCGINCMALA